MTDHLTQARLDELWTFDAASESERRFRDELTRVPAASPISADITTQLARALGLEGRFDEADALLDSIDDSSATVLARILLERGRLRNSSRHPDVAIPLIEEALAAASAVGDDFLAIDAAHMLGIADPARDFGTPQQQVWAQEAIDEVVEAIGKRAQ